MLILINPIDGIRAAEHWLVELAPAREAHTRNKHAAMLKKLESALANDQELLDILHKVLKDAMLFGRADGLCEGMTLYEYGEKLQKRHLKNPAFHSIVHYLAKVSMNCNGRDLTMAPSVPQVCLHLDAQIRRIDVGRPKSDRERIAIRPPKSWGCETWSEAYSKKRNNVDKLVSEAKSVALSEQYATLMAWRTWGTQRKIDL